MSACGCPEGACVHWGGLQPATGRDADVCAKCQWMRVNHWCSEAFGDCQAFVEREDEQPPSRHPDFGHTSDLI